MLEKRLIAQTCPKAKDENIIFWKDYRITVLQNRLFRIEKNQERTFRDCATQSIWFRNAEKQFFTLDKTNDELQIKTSACVLRVFENFEDCRIRFAETEYEINNSANLKGTYRTLDRCDGNRYIPSRFNPNGVEYDIELENGVCSRNGVAVFDDVNSLSLSDNGEVLPERGQGLDIYVFAYGNDYKAAVRALYSVCGAPPIVPRFALGNWWSRYHEYTDREYLQLINKFKTNGVPLTVATVDMDWHYSAHIDEQLGITRSGKNSPEYVGDGSMGWTGYSWNKYLFPDYKDFLSKVKQSKLKITLNLHPADGVRWWEDKYAEMAKATGKDPQEQKQIAFDFTDPDFINAYFNVLHKPYERDGVDFWWIDWQQGTKSKTDGLDPLWALNHYHYYDIKSSTHTPLILSRYSGIGSHRYPVGFSGDTHITWKTLQYLPYFTATASNVGYTWWSNDIGGHMLGEVSGELYLRHIQFGVFSPINRLHSSDARVTTKEPWYYGNGIGEIAKKWLRFRHSMIPFLYSQSIKTHENGVALIEPLYYEWKDKNAYAFKNEYIFGEQLLVAPVTTPMRKGFSSTSLWLPKGVWTDIFTGDEYVIKKAKKITSYRNLESIPVFAKAGTVLPLSEDSGNSCENPMNLGVWIYSGEGVYTLIEDGRENGNDGVFKTQFSLSTDTEDGKLVQYVSIYGDGDVSVLPHVRRITLYFKNIKQGTATVRFGGVPLDPSERYDDCVSMTVPFCANTACVVKVVYDKKSDIEKAIDRVREIMLSVEGDNLNKNECFATFEKSPTVGKLKKEIKKSNLHQKVKRRLLESL